MIAISAPKFYLGQAIASVLELKSEICTVIENDGIVADAARLKDLIDQYNPNAFINCFEFPNSAEAEFKRSETYRINATLNKELAEVCSDKNILYVYPSSVYIFNGNKEWNDSLREYIENTRKEVSS